SPPVLAAPSADPGHRAFRRRQDRNGPHAADSGLPVGRRSRGGRTMTRRIRDHLAAGFLILVPALACTAQRQAGHDTAVDALHCAETRQVDLVEALHGVEVADPSRGLEDLDAPETAAWVTAPNAVTVAHLDA